MIPLSVPSIQGNEWLYIKECLDTEWVSSAGKYVDLFENKMEDYLSVNCAVAVMNGTSALHLSLLIVGVKADDEVIVPTLTFIAPINAVKYIGAEPVFMDSDNYYNIHTEKTIEFILKETIFQNGYTWNKKTGKRISAIITVHVFGNACDLLTLINLCNERNIKVVEDATESLGTIYSDSVLKGRHTATIGDIGCLSFNGNKIITTGGGGMIVTNNNEYAEKARYLSTQAKDDAIQYIHNEIGYNYRMTNIQAAMGVAQIERLNEFIEIKRNNYNNYKNQIDLIEGLHIAETPSYCNPNYWFYALQIDKDKYGFDRDELMKILDSKGIQTRPLWFPNHQQKPFKNNQSYKIEMAMNLLNSTLNLPCSVNLTKENIQTVIDELKK